MRVSSYICSLALLAFPALEACTGIVRQAQNGDCVYARTMEFPTDLLNFELALVPRGISYTGTTPSGKPGLAWDVKYGHVGFAPFGLPLLADGVNERGLACGAFYMPGWTEYEAVTPKEAQITISNVEFVSWVLGNFQTVGEVREALSQTKVAAAVMRDWGFSPPLHYFVADSTGNKAVIEYVGGRQYIYEAPLGTITNSPPYDWHQTNAKNYIGLSALNRPSIEIGGMQFSQFGQGSGAIGLPGDFTPPSRFIRAAFLRAVTLPGKDGREEINNCFAMMDQFNIPRGAIRQSVEGREVFDVTQWTSAADLGASRYYFHSLHNRNVRMIDLRKLDLNSRIVKTISVDEPVGAEDISYSFKMIR